MNTLLAVLAVLVMIAAVSLICYVAISTGNE